MIKPFSLVLLGAFFVTSFAQVPDSAIDFKSKDTKGVEHHFFSYLDAGKYVLIEFIKSE